MEEFFWELLVKFCDFLFCAMPFLGLIGIACVVIFLVKKFFNWVDSEENQHISLHGKLHDPW